MKAIRIAVIFIGIFFSMTIFSACSKDSDGITVTDTWARPGLEEGNSGVFFVIDNGASIDDKLISAASDVSEVVELHKSTMVDDAMKMEMQKFVSIPGGEKVVFKPGDFHVMLIGLNDDLAVGDTFEVRLEFESTGAVSLDVAVREP